jgi:hypothetical protein
MKLIPTSAAAFALTCVAHSAVLVDSTFTDSSLGAGGRNATNSSNLTPWFLISTATSGNATVVNDATLGKSMQVNSGNSIYTAFADTTLLDGETITLTMDYRFTGTPTTGSETFRVALYDANAAAAITADQGSISDANEQEYAGYYAGLAIGANPVTGGSVLRQRDTGNSNALTSSSQSSTLAFTNVGVASGTTVHTLEYSITRTGSSLAISAEIDGVPFVSVTDSTAIYTTFNAFAFAGVGGTVVVDNIQIVTVPEPTTGMLVGLGLLPLAVLLRRRRRA